MPTSSFARRLSALTIAHAMLISTVAMASGQTSKQAADKESQPPSPTTTNPKPDGKNDRIKGSRELAMPSSSAADYNGGDYIPCKFTLPQLRSLTAPEISPTLTEADEEMLKERVIAEAVNGDKAKAIQTSDADQHQKVDPTSFVDELSSASLAGLTPSQALNTVIKILNDSKNENPSQSPATLEYKADIVNTARQSIVQLQRPPDIGCAMSILTYEETNHAYGHLIATQYIAVQVVVRNTNREQDFVLHDVALQVNADPSGRLGGFYSGRDKVVVRALSSAQNSKDPRALVVHSAEAVGAILSSIVPIFATNPLTDATAVFNGGVVPGIDKIWKDRTADQLNLLNDTGFSSEASEQISVPTSGTVMFVIFIPSKQFEEGWWTQSCVNNVYIGTRLQGGSVQIRSRKSEDAHSPTDTQPPTAKPIQGDVKSTKQKADEYRRNYDEAGVDIGRALEVCQSDLVAASKQDKSLNDPQRLVALPISENIAKGQPTTGTGTLDEKFQPVGDLFRKAHPLAYKKWSGTSLAIFRELSTVVVAGTHTIEESQLQPSVTTIACDTTSTGDIIFPQPEKDTLTCPVSGKNLDKVAKLRLRNANNATDTVTAEGAVSISGDSTNGTVSFPTAALHALPASAYSVFSVSSKGVEQKTNLTMHFSADPCATDATLGADQTLTIKGSHLAAADKVLVTHPSDSNKKALELNVAEAASKSATQLSFKLSSDNLKTFDNDEQLGLLFKIGDRAISTDKEFRMTNPSGVAGNNAKQPANQPKQTKPAVPPKKQTRPQSSGGPKTDNKP